MASAKKNNLFVMRDISKNKDGHDKAGHGIWQVPVQISSKNKLMNDNKFVQGKRILQEKIYSKIN